MEKKMDKKTVFGGVFQGLRVLITGHTGFKGSWLSIWLKELGANVLGFSRGVPTDPSNFQLCQLERRITHGDGDIRDPDRVLEIIRKYQPEVVIHMAAQPLVLAAYQKPKETFDTNVLGTVNVLEAIRQTKSVKAFIGVTTDKVYKDQKWIWGYRENDLLGGYDPYSASKAMAELAIQSYQSSWPERGFSDHPVALASARAGNVIGGGDLAQFRLVPDCMQALKAGTPVEVRSPKSVRPWQLVMEPLSGYLWLAAHLLGEANKRLAGEKLRAEDTFSGAWNFGPLEHEAINCETIARKAVELWGSGRYVLSQNPSQGHETSVLRVNWDKAANRLAWRPTYTWEDALSETVDWWKEYQRQEQAGGAVDMYDVCVKHIEQYVSRARELGIPWANP
jgi:CDP-glucose 4,6-dehydratase